MPIRSDDSIVCLVDVDGHLYLHAASLEDAINAARSQADMHAASARQAQERKQRERTHVQVLAAEAVTHLAELGAETFFRVQRATRFQRGEIYRDPAGQRYGVAVEQRCWVLSKMSGVRNGEGPWMDSPVLLLADGTIGRFWPIPPRAPADPGRGAPADDGRLYVGRATRSPHFAASTL